MKLLRAAAAIVIGCLMPIVAPVTRAVATTGPVAVQGFVKTDTGKPVISAIADLLYWSDTTSLEKGQEVSRVVVGHARSAADGSYRLVVTPNALLEQAAGRNAGWVNFELLVRPPGGFGKSTFLSRRLTGHSWQGRDQNGHSTLAVSTTVSAGATATAATYYYHCKTVLDSQTALSSRIIDFHNASNADSSWTYGSTADSDIDVGVNLSGKGWGVSGTTHIGNANGASISGRTSYTYNRYARTYFNYATIEYVAAYPSEGGVRGDWCTDGINKIGTRRTYANKWAGGTDDDAGTTATSCVSFSAYALHYGKGASLTVNSGRETKIGFSVDAGGAHLGATNGYSTYVRMMWTATRGALWICGRYDFATQPDRGIVYVQNYS